MPIIKRLLNIFFVMVTFCGSYAQQMNVDSLKLVVNKNVADTTKLSAIGYILVNVPSDSKDYVFYNEKFKAISEGMLKNKNLDANSREYALSGIGNYYINKGFMTMRTDYIQTIKNLEKSLEYFQSEKSKSYRGAVLINLGIMYDRIGNSSVATNNFFKALRIFESLKDPSNIAYATQSIADLYVELKKYDDALKYYLKTYSIYYKTDNLGFQDKIQKVQLFISMGHCYLELNQCEQSQSHLDKALSMAIELDDAGTLSDVYYAMGKNEERCHKNYFGALKQFQQSLTAGIGPERESKTFTAIGEVFLKLKQYDKAETNLIQGMNIAKKLKMLKFQRNAAGDLVVLYKQRKQFEKAFEMKELYAMLKDSIGLEENNNAFLKKELQYEFENKENRNKLAQERKLNAIKLETQKKNAVKNNWLIGLSGLLLVLIIGAYFYYRNSKQKQSIAALEKTQIKQKLLITQMNPHFIFNSIQNIRSLIHEHQNNAAVNYLDKFSRLTRQILENSNENYISLEEEVEMIENYLAIQQLLYQNKFDYTINVDKKIETENLFLPPMLTQPFIENAIKHGLGNKTENGKIDIHFYLKETHLFFEVTDNGNGFDASKKTDNHKSLAMTITKERLVSYTKNQDFIVQTDNLTDEHQKVVGAKVGFEIPYIYEN